MWWLIFFPVISAFIGWITNWVAIKMLFHPRLPTKILGINFQGIFPKRQRQFAEKLGKLVSTELLSFGDIEEKITSPGNLSKIMPVLEAHIDEFLRVKLAEKIPMIGMFVGEQTIGMMKEVLLDELNQIIPVMMKSYMGSLQSELDLEQIVVEKVSSFSTDKLEQILNQIMSKEFVFIEIVGAVLGFAIGLLQVIITLAAR